METIQDKLKAAAAGNASSLLQDSKTDEDTPVLPSDAEVRRTGFRAIGHKVGYQTDKRIIKADVFGFYVPENKEEEAFLQSKVEEGVLTFIK